MLYVYIKTKLLPRKRKNFSQPSLLVTHTHTTLHIPNHLTPSTQHQTPPGQTKQENMAPTGVITSIDANAIGLKKIASGKVREIFEVDENTLLFVASDRISAYDVILTNVSEVKLRSAQLNSVQEKEKKTQKPPTNFFLFLFTY